MSLDPLEVELNIIFLVDLINFVYQIKFRTKGSIGKWVIVCQAVFTIANEIIIIAYVSDVKVGKA